MTKKINPTIEVQQTKTGNFGPLFDGKDISETELMGNEQPERRKKLYSTPRSRKRMRLLPPWRLNLSEKTTTLTLNIASPKPGPIKRLHLVK
jgi:hypothetical protein